MTTTSRISTCSLTKTCQVGDTKGKTHRPNELSRAQQQVAAAHAWVNDPATILAGEPARNLDSKSSQEITFQRVCSIPNRNSL